MLSAEVVCVRWRKENPTKSLFKVRAEILPNQMLCAGPEVMLGLAEANLLRLRMLDQDEPESHSLSHQEEMEVSREEMICPKATQMTQGKVQVWAQVCRARCSWSHCHAARLLETPWLISTIPQNSIVMEASGLVKSRQHIKPKYNTIQYNNECLFIHYMLVVLWCRAWWCTQQRAIMWAPEPKMHSTLLKASVSTFGQDSGF